MSISLVWESFLGVQDQDPSKTWTKNMVFEKFPVVGGWWVFLVLYRVSQKKVLLRNIVQFQEFEQSNYQYFEVMSTSIP